MLIEILRSKTQNFHDSIEYQWFSKLILNNPPIDFYQRYLLAWQEIYIAYNIPIQFYKIKNWQNLFSDSIKNLRFDLHGLSLKHPPPTLPQLVPPKLNEISCWGALYVLNGSALGGLVIAKQLEKTASPLLNKHKRFFYGHGKETHRIWHEFLNGLKTLHSLSDTQRQSIILSAINTFSTIEKYLSDTLIQPESKPHSARLYQ